MNTSGGNSIYPLTEDFSSGGRTKGTVVFIANLEHQPPTKSPINYPPTTELPETSSSVISYQQQELEHYYTTEIPTTQTPLTSSPSSIFPELSTGLPIGHQETPTQSTIVNSEINDVNQSKRERRLLRKRERKNGTQKIKITKNNE